MTNQSVTRYVRYTQGGRTSYGVLEGDTVHELTGSLFDNPQPSGRTAIASEVRFEIPIDPDNVQKVIGLTSQFSETQTPAPHLRLFGMFATSLLRNGGEIEIPPECKHIHHEGEMVVVIGKTVPRFTSVEDAPDYVFGVCVGNDVTDAGWYSEREGVETPSRLIGKAVDTWSPIGDQIVAGLDYNDLGLTARLNGKTAFDVRTSQMNNSVAQTISYLSEYIALYPGDLIFMGTPEIGPDLLEMKAGDVVEIELEGVGIVRNPVVEMKRPAVEPPRRPTAHQTTSVAPVSGNVTQYVRYTAGDETSFGRLEGDTIYQIEGGLFEDEPRETGKTYRLSDVKLGVPLDLSTTRKVFGVASAYNDPEQQPRYVPHPRWFLKIPTAIRGHETDVDLPEHALNLSFEGELVVIIGKQGRHISLADAPGYVWGVTIGNDWTENVWSQEAQPTERPSRYFSKAMDTWGSLYPVIYRNLDYSDLQIDIRMNGELVARGRTSSMINSVPYLIHYISHFVTLQPGDVIYSGTVAPPSFPGVRRQMQDGDVIEVEIENIGTLKNTVRAMKQRGSSFNPPRPATT